jgi:predicted RNase H-like HicB family nuclease
MHDDYDGFGIRIQEEGDELMAQFIELPEIAACGATVTAALVELKAVWEATKHIYIKHQSTPNRL